MTSFPSLFLAHGAPDLPLGDHPAKRFLTELGARLPRPRAILIVSAHWEAPTPTLGTAPRPETIYDFGGFAPELRRLSYPARTDPGLIERVSALLGAAGVVVGRDPERGYDHGVWVPLFLAYPKADLPVVQLSLQDGADAARHLILGRALAPLRAEGVLIIASGATAHNLGALSPEGTRAPDWAVSFDDWVHHSVQGGDQEALTAFPGAPATARRAHPTPEHFMPLLVALGAGGEGGVGRRIHHSFSYGSIGMASFAFGSEADVALADGAYVQ